MVKMPCDMPLVHTFRHTFSHNGKLYVKASTFPLFEEHDLLSRCSIANRAVELISDPVNSY
jgi:hypothetical protein